MPIDSTSASFSSSSSSPAALMQEWSRLQADHEQYERGALWIKLAAIGLYAWGLGTGLGPLGMGLLMLLLWLQEAVFKTYQARLGERLLKVEAGLRQDPSLPAGQLHSEWLAARPRGAALLAGYVRSACRPTVALPYLVLLLVSVGQLLRG